MNIKAPEGMSSAERIAFYDCEENRKYYQYGTAGGWKNMGKIRYSAETMEPALTFRYCWKKEKRGCRYLKCGFPGGRKGLSATRKVRTAFIGRIRVQYWSRCLGLPGRRMKSTVLRLFTIMDSI